MTVTALLADERYEGKMEWSAEGKAEERLEVVSQMLSRGYSPEQISDILVSRSRNAIDIFNTE